MVGRAFWRGEGVEFQLLGPVTISNRGTLLSFRAKQLAILTALLCQPNRVVSKAEIIRLAWEPDEQAATAEDLITDYVSKLRKIAEQYGQPLDIETHRGAGFKLAVDEATIDYHRFLRYVEDGAAAVEAGGDDEAAELFSAGLDQWRGPALGGLGSAFDPLRRIVENRRVQAAEMLGRIELARGGADRVASMLDALAAQHPDRERLTALRIRALGATGRRAEAIELFRQSRRQLADELGLDPDDELSTAFQEVLRTEPARYPAGPPGRMQLPAETPNFVGRTAEMAELRALLPWAEHLTTTPAEGAPVVPVHGRLICAVHGMAGVGKTAFAVHAAHEIARWFPDGQLFLNLHAFTTKVPRVSATEALYRLLRALGVTDKEIPKHPDDRAALYRDRLVGTRTLIVLDNALNAEQVEPLLPPTGECLVLLTSRRRLPALDDAHLILMEPLPIPDAASLLRKVVGGHRFPDRWDVAERIAELCGGLPLALRIIASRMRNRPTWRPEQLADRLTDELRLTELNDGERSAGAAFTLSYHDLDDPQRRLFRLVGISPGRDIDAPAAAALLDLPVRRATQLLEQLLDNHLLGQQVAGRYVPHDLVREYATRRAEDEDTAEDRQAALRRWLDHQLQTAAFAMDRLYPHEKNRRPQLATPARAISPVFSYGLARTWLDAERPNLIAAAARAVEFGDADYACTLDAVLYRYLISAGHYHDAVTLHGYALQAARTQSSLRAEGLALAHFGRTYRRLGLLETSLDYSRRALTVLEQDRNGADDAERARVLADIGIALGLHGRYDRGIEHLSQALDLARELSLVAEEANILTSLGNLHLVPGRPAVALHLYGQAHALYVRTGNQAGEATALSNLGVVYEKLGFYAEAVNYQLRAIDLFTSVGDRERVAFALSGLGDAHRELGQLDQALDEHSRALAIFREIGQLHGVAGALSDVAATYAALGELGQCPDRYREALRIAYEIGDHTLEAEVLNRLGSALRRLDRTDEALTRHQEALAVAGRIGNDDQQARSLAGIGMALVELGRPYHAHWYLGSAVVLLAQLGLPAPHELAEFLGRYDEPEPSG